MLFMKSSFEVIVDEWRMIIQNSPQNIFVQDCMSSSTSKTTKICDALLNISNVTSVSDIYYYYYYDDALGEES